MIESTIEPDAVQFRRIRVTDEGLKLDLLIHWDIAQETIENEDGETHIQFSYKECELTVSYEGAKSAMNEFLTNQEPRLILKAKAKYEVEKDTDKLSTEEISQLDDIQKSVLYATIVDIDTDRPDKKYVLVKKTMSGQVLQRWCYITYSLLLAHQNSSLAIGDYVIINFVDDDLDKPIVIDKVIGFKGDRFKVS